MPYERFMLAPWLARLLRYGACEPPITLERCLFSKITTTMWSGRGTEEDLGFFCLGGAPAGSDFLEPRRSVGLDSF